MWTPRFIDSHTLGEPTRVVLDPPPELVALPAGERCAALTGALAARRAAVVGEPRTSDAVVGAFLVPPDDPTCQTGVIFFNDVGTLGMCVHGTIGVVATLAHLGEISAGSHRIETPVGVVTATLDAGGSIAVESVPCHRAQSTLSVETSGGPIEGEVLWGGNWFFHVDPSPIAITLESRDDLLELTHEIRRSVDSIGITGDDGSPIDHIGLFERIDPELEGAHARNFVLCPGGAYDRSPCGTGTSAWLAARHLDGQLDAGEVWTIESVVGSRFEGSVARSATGEIVPTIRGRASIVAEGTLFLDPEDPFPTGIPQ